MIWQIETPTNQIDTISTYAKDTEERKMVQIHLDLIKNHPSEIPLYIDGKSIYTDHLLEVRAPHDHSQILAKIHLAQPEQLNLAIEASLHAQQEWANLNWLHRISIFKKAAHLLSTTRRYEHIASIMLNQSKTPYEAEIDLTEMIDFLNFNTKFLEEIYIDQPNQSPGEFNRLDWRPLEGFVLAVPPFNFYSIGGNLATAPAMAGNVVIWKPARSAVYSNFKIMEVLIEAGLPPGVINFVPFESKYSKILLTHPHFAGLHFTGSYGSLVDIWQTIGQNLPNYRNFPRIVGETGGKDFIIMHESADIDQVIINILRGGYEYQGQKCSACSRVYIPDTKWNAIKTKLIEEIRNVSFGDVTTLNVAGGAVIDKSAFLKIKQALELARTQPETYEVIAGGTWNDSKGWFIDPTLIVSKDPKSRLMQEEIFGPVVIIYVYPAAEFEQTLKICDQTSPYALTGAIFAQDRKVIIEAETQLRYAAGNFYINDKPTGAIVSRQPFGGARASGTNDKAGSKSNLLRWLSPRTIKENYNTVKDWRRPFML